MDHKQYENYVESVVRALSISKNATIHKNRRFLGVRQPGHYEIDIACEIKIDEVLYLLIIIECKNWSRPVDREEIQKLIQTRDAISAHKAAFASASGYTKEAVEVAKANGVALWVIGDGIFHAQGAGGLAANAVGRMITENFVDYIYELIGYNGEPFYSLFPFDWLLDKNTNLLNQQLDFDLKGRLVRCDSVVALLIEQIRQNSHSQSSLVEKVIDWISKYKQVLTSSGMNLSMANRFLDEVIAFAISRESFFGSYENIESFDKQLPHQSTILVAPIDWLTQNSESFFISTSSGSPSWVRLENSVIWANVIWLLSLEGLLANGGRTAEGR